MPVHPYTLYYFNFNGMPYELDHIETLIARDINNSLSTEEKVTLEAWLSEDAEHRRYYEALQRTWALTAGAGTGFEPNTEKNWERFRAHLTSTMPRQRFLYTYRHVLRIAAAVILLAGAATIYFTRFHHPEVNVITQARERKTVTLPDGSKAFLNQQSSIQYAAGFSGGERAVHLEGEAFFEVTHSSDKPFVVYAGPTKTTVLGTSFDVKAYEHNKVEVAVVSGKVAFSSGKGQEQRLVLTKGNKGVLREREALQQLPIVDPNFMAWKENRLSFHDTPMSEVVSNLETYFGVRITLADNSIADYGYNGTFDNPQLEDILKVISGTMGLEYTKEQDQYILRRPAP